jgi:hypothetical protein
VTTEPAWRLTDGKDGDVYVLADALDGEVPNYQRGGSVTLNLLFFEGGRYDADRGMTYGDTDAASGAEGTGGTYGQVAPSAAGRTYGTDGTLSGVGRYEQAREYLDYAGTVRTGTSLDGTPYYRESAGTSVASHVLAFEPLADVTGVNGFWGVVTGGNDPSANPPAMYELEVKTFVLAERDEFESRSAVAAAYNETP